MNSSSSMDGCSRTESVGRYLYQEAQGLWVRNPTTEIGIVSKFRKMKCRVKILNRKKTTKTYPY